MEQDKIEYGSGATEALLADAYGEIKEQIVKCYACNAKFNFKGRRVIAFCGYCGGAVIDGSEQQTTLDRNPLE